MNTNSDTLETRNSQGLFAFSLERNWPLFALRARAKEPATRHGYRDATCDAALLAAMRRQNPGCNWGSPMGDFAAPGCLPVNRFCIDIDPRRGGDETWDELLRIYGPAEAAVEQLSGGGRHLFWQQIPGLGCRTNLFPGIDLKADGGYVAVSPSIHPDTRGRYCWEVDHDPRDRDVTPAPERLQRAIIARAGTVVGPDALAAPDGPLPVIGVAEWTQLVSTPSETRHAVLIRIAGHLLRRRVNGNLVLGLCQLWNAANARPERLPDEAERNKTGHLWCPRVRHEMGLRAGWVPFGSHTGSQAAHAAHDPVGRSRPPDTDRCRVAGEPGRFEQPGLLRASTGIPGGRSRWIYLRMAAHRHRGQTLLLRSPSSPTNRHGRSARSSMRTPVWRH
jgi:hypothetical protein